MSTDKNMKVSYAGLGGGRTNFDPKKDGLKIFIKVFMVMEKKDQNLSE